MRHVGKARWRQASAEDQTYYRDVDDYFNQTGWPAYQPTPEEWLEFERRIPSLNAQRVTAVLDSSVKILHGRRLRDVDYEAVNSWQENGRPIPLGDTADGRAEYFSCFGQLWEVGKDEYFEDDEERDLLLQAAARKQQLERERRLQEARRITGDEQSLNRRFSIPDDVKIFVWRRDEGACTRCGSNEDLEFDHIIPLAMGGSSTARNLQLLCGSCNRAKGARLL